MNAVETLVKARKLSERKLQILCTLDEQGGLLTRQVAAQIPQFGDNGHQHSGAVRAWLVALKKHGLVALLDGQKPDCWIRTPEGRAIALASKGERG